MSITAILNNVRGPVVALTALGALTLSACSDSSSNGAGPAKDATPPSISLTSSSELVMEEGDITLTASASDNEDVTVVEFYDGGTMLGSVDSNPFEWTRSYTETDNGMHSHWAVAKDAAGNSAESETLSVIVAINLQPGFLNGDFATDDSGWTVLDCDQWSGYISGEGDPPGLMRLNEYGTCEVDPGIEQEISGLIPGLTYEIAGEYRPYVDWYGNPAAESFVITVDGEVLASMARGPQGSDWSPFTVEFVPTAFVHTIGFYAEWGCDDSSYDVDNLSIALKTGN